MFTYGDVTQITICLNSKVVKVLQEIANDGNYPDVSSLIESVLVDVALDEGLLRDLKQVAKTKSNGKHRAVA